MARRDIIVIGGSAGGIEALRAVVRDLPADLPAAVFVVVHIPAASDSRLPDILGRAARLPVAPARNGEPIEHGRIAVAPPDQHLLLRRGYVELSHGPRENRSRPAIDPLFRSAARAYGERVIGVILSGALYDGGAGLLAVKAHAGSAIVQDPGEAVVSGMPQHALDLVEADCTLPADEIGAALVRMTGQDIEETGEAAMVDGEERITRVIAEDFAEQADNATPDAKTIYTCPECGGVLWQTDASAGGFFQCHVGHIYAPEVLLGQKAEEVEGALWACVRLLKEKATLTRQSAAQAHARGNGEFAQSIDEQAHLEERRAQVIRELLEALPGTDEAQAVEP